MLKFLYQILLVNPILNMMVALYKVFGNFGVALIILTVVIRLLLIPAVLPSMKMAKKQRDLQPELDKLRKKFSHDKKVLAQKQMELLKKHGVNPASGCLSQIAMMVVLFALYSVIRKFSYGTELAELNKIIYFDSLRFASLDDIRMKFLYLDLSKPDPFYILAILSGVFQLISSKMMAPYTKAGQDAAKKTPDRSDDVAYNVQSQMLYTMPIMSVLIGIKLPSGVVLNWLVTTLFMIFQTYFVSGLGGLQSWIDKIRLLWKKQNS